MASSSEAPDGSAKTPFTIVTGFLGAGKTTLINYILTEQRAPPRDKRICVIENEFGEINIDEKLVSENMASKEDLIQMDNGCACCSIRGDLVRTLGGLVEKRTQFDAVMLETTGLADPAPIIATLKSNQWIDDNFVIDSVLCLASAKHVQSHLDEVKPEGAVNEAVQQIAFCDKVLLNKVDLVNDEELAAITARVKTINHFAEIITSTRALRVEGAEGQKKVHDLSMVSSCGIAVEGFLDVPKFNMFMAELLQARAADLYRTKGVLSFAGQGAQKFVFQGVHEQIDFGPAKTEWQKDEPRWSKIVFIGRNLDRKYPGEVDARGRWIFTFARSAASTRADTVSK
ncbi:ATP binding protein [Aureococcus anophagefferens]|nr:ATP binding protein [Aureococcus anophagefferens]